MKKIILIILSFYLSTMAFSQTTTSAQEETNSMVEIKHDRGFSTEYYYQGKFGFALGGIIGKNLGSKVKQNYSCGIYTDIISSKNSIFFGPRLKLNWNYLGIFGVGINFHNHYRLYSSELDDFRITPEINFSLYGLANVFVGYSFNVSKTKFDDLADFRIGVNINILRKK